MSANTKCKSKTSKCASSFVPISNKFKPLTDFCSKPSTAHPPSNCKQCNTKSEKVGFKQSKAKPNKTKCAKSKGEATVNKRLRKLIAAVLNAAFAAEDPVIDNSSAELALKSLFDIECLGILRGTVSDPD